MSFDWWVQTLRDVFNIESTAAIVLVTAGVGAALGGGFGYFVDKSHKKAEERRLLESSQAFTDRYVVAKGPTFRIDTLDQDLRKVGIQFTSISSPQLKPTPETDAARQEYFQLKSGLYLRCQWRGGVKMPEDTRAMAERVILAHEARLQ